jgi:hypothetical protein
LWCQDLKEILGICLMENLIARGLRDRTGRSMTAVRHVFSDVWCCVLCQCESVGAYVDVPYFLGWSDPSCLQVERKTALSVHMREEV